MRFKQLIKRGLIASYIKGYAHRGHLYMSEIQLHEPLGNFVYFFIGTCVLATIGAHYPGLAEIIGNIMQEHIAGKTIFVAAGLSLFIGYICALKNIFSPSNYNLWVKLFIVTPSQFTITLACVAAAINWGVVLSSYFLFPIIVEGQILKGLFINALEITGIALLLIIGLISLHYSPSEPKRCNSFATFPKSFFWIVFIISTIIWISFFCRIIWLVCNG